MTFEGLWASIVALVLAFLGPLLAWIEEAFGTEIDL